MRARSKLAFASAATALAFSLAVANASANDLSISNKSFRVVWTALRFIGGTSTVSCQVTVEGSFHEATTVKVVGTLLGYITRSRVGTCTGGSATVLSATLPWHIQYAGFTGTLPTITAIFYNAIGLSFRITPEGSLPCLLSTNAAHPAKFEGVVESTGTFFEFNARVEAEIPLTSEFGLCRWSGAAHLEGRANFTVGGSTTRITIRLI